jgi:hypothetical protein
MICIAQNASLLGTMLEKSMESETEEGNLIFDDGQTVSVDYWAEQDGSGGWHGRVSHAEGDPNWHPMVSVNRGPFTLAMCDGRKLKVFLELLKGSFHGANDQAA